VLQITAVLNTVRLTIRKRKIRCRNSKMLSSGLQSQHAALQLISFGRQPSACCAAKQFHRTSMARSRGVRSAGSTLQYAATKDTDDSESVLRLFEDLTISSVADGRIVSLSELDRQLRDWYEQEGISMKKFKDLLQTHAICLGDCQAYHSQEALKQALRADPSKIISRQKAKQYKFVKKCLIIL